MDTKEIDSFLQTLTIVLTGVSLHSKTIQPLHHRKYGDSKIIYHNLSH